MKRILIVEDDRPIARNISLGLQHEGYQTEIAFEGPEGQNKALLDGVDLVILDINLPGRSGMEVCRFLRQAKPHLPIILLTALGEVENKVEGLQSGADDYLVKPFDLRELCARVATCFRRAQRLASPLDEERLQVADLVVNVSTRAVYRQGQLIQLTAKEFSLLEHLVRNQGRVQSRVDLTERVWNLHFDPGTNVVEVYINYLRKKIDRDFEPKLIHTRPGLGYVLQAE
jgi:DNA-binding response OmpR family regulator